MTTDKTDPNADAFSARIDALEAHIAHQDQAIEDLNEIVLAQREALDRLTRRLDKMHARVDDLEEAAPAPENRPPPHY